MVCLVCSQCRKYSVMKKRKTKKGEMEDKDAGDPAKEMWWVT